MKTCKALPPSVLNIRIRFNLFMNSPILLQEMMAAIRLLLAIYLQTSYLTERRLGTQIPKLLNQVCSILIYLFEINWNKAIIGVDFSAFGLQLQGQIWPNFWGKTGLTSGQNEHNTISKLTLILNKSWWRTEGSESTIGVNTGELALIYGTPRYVYVGGNFTSDVI